MKWRTKSQILLIDKWKERYGRSEGEHTMGRKSHSLAKIIKEKSSGIKTGQKLEITQSKLKKSKLITELERKMFPSISKTLRGSEILKISENLDLPAKQKDN